MIQLRLTTTPSGHTALWQQGGGNSRFGESLIITDRTGKPKIPVQVNKKPDLNHHCLIPVETEDIVIIVKNTRGITTERVYEFRDQSLYLFNERVNGVWKLDLSCMHLAKKALQVAKSNSCRSPQKAVFYMQR